MLTHSNRLDTFSLANGLSFLYCLITFHLEVLQSSRVCFSQVDQDVPYRIHSPPPLYPAPTCVPSHDRKKVVSQQ